MTAPVVLVTARSFGTGTRDLAAELSADGIRVLRGPADHRALEPLLAQADAWIAGTGPVTDAHLAAAPRLRIVARYGVGVDAVDLAAAARRGVLVTNTPGANSGAGATAVRTARSLIPSIWRCSITNTPKPMNAPTTLNPGPADPK